MPRGGGGTAPGGRRVPPPTIGVASEIVGAGGRRTRGCWRWGAGMGVLKRGDRSITPTAEGGSGGGSFCFRSTIGSCTSRARAPSALENCRTRSAGIHCFQPDRHTKVSGLILPWVSAARSSASSMGFARPVSFAKHQRSSSNLEIWFLLLSDPGASGITLNPFPSPGHGSG